MFTLGRPYLRDISFLDIPLCMYSMQILRRNARLNFVLPISLNHINNLTFKALWESTYFSTRQVDMFLILVEIKVFRYAYFAKGCEDGFLLYGREERVTAATLVV